MDNETNPVERLRVAMLEDVKDTLMDRRNNLLTRELDPKCACKNNCDFVLGKLKRSPSETLELFSTIEKYVLSKKCKHVWHRERQMNVSWDALDFVQMT